MKKYIFIIPILLIVVSFFFYDKIIKNNETLKPDCKKIILIVSYNVENLFDTIDTPNKYDNEFTPQSEKKWNTKRYFKKINDISKVLSLISKKHLPDLIGIVEIENRAVLEDLISTKYLKKEKYKIVHEESSDPRGIDVALLYNPKIFKYYSHKLIPIINNDGERYNTREIMMVKGLIAKDTVCVFINHWKSRSGGRNETEYKRILAAKILRKNVDEQINNNSNVHIICIGDFNDTPFDKSMEKTLNASIDKVFDSDRELYNLSAFDSKNKKGTISYRNNWYMLDNIIVSQNFLDKSNKIVAQGNSKIYSSKFNLYYNAKANDSIPNRSYGGNSYYGGISDHLPVYGFFVKK
ncbi:MAG: hypothetical protein U9Q83_03090 [Bacteroidota bacterium]|nr:hypothetical protein [Bacteroidota bacterium]